MLQTPDQTTLRPRLLLRASNLEKAYGGRPAICDVSLELKAGEVVALLGPNGAGKSTLLQMLTGLFTPDKGQIEILGENMGLRPARALAHLGVVFQQPALDIDLSVTDNLLFHTDLHGLPRERARHRIQTELELFGLQAEGMAVVRSLSGGSRRKIELVRALLHEPELLLLDEATVGLDPASRQQLLDKVQRLCRLEGKCVLWATHLIEEVAIADRLVIMARGRIRFDGSIEQFMAAHAGQNLQNALLDLLQDEPATATRTQAVLP
jgi:ABC-2 type transport system ATP-binding protein